MYLYASTTLNNFFSFSQDTYSRTMKPNPINQKPIPYPFRPSDISRYRYTPSASFLAESDAIAISIPSTT